MGKVNTDRLRNNPIEKTVGKKMRMCPVQTFCKNFLKRLFCTTTPSFSNEIHCNTYTYIYNTIMLHERQSKRMVSCIYKFAI